MNEAEAAPAGALANDASRADLNVLLLEDSSFDAELLHESLRQSYPDLRLTRTTDEDGFAAELRGGCFDIILSDYQLPGFSGAEALDLAQQACPHVPFIFVSGVIGEDNAVDLLKRGATDYVIKSRLARLPVAIARALSEVAQRDARRAAEDRLRQAKDEAERANRAKDRFLAVLSHELRTPLTPIAAAATVLERCAVVPERFQHLLPMIRRNVEIEARLIDDLLDLTAIGAGKLRLRREPVDLHPLIHAVAQMLADDIARAEITLTLHLNATHSRVNGDAARLQQVLWNILRNAVKFTPTGGRIEVVTADADGDLVVRCTDSGIGIEANVLPHIFQPFEQADVEVSRQYGGLGLGLAIAHGLVQHHDGRLTAHSDGPNRGATLTLHLPVLQADATSPTAHQPAPVTPAPHTPVRLLLVEDNVDAAEALSLSLEDLGYHVRHADSLRQAFAALDDGTFDAVVTDLGLPDGSGIEIGRRLQGRIPVLALTGFGASGDLLASHRAGFADHLVKPVDPDSVHAALQRVLARGTSRHG